MSVVSRQLNAMDQEDQRVRRTSLSAEVADTDCTLTRTRSLSFPDSALTGTALTSISDHHRHSVTDRAIIRFIPTLYT
jgi:hypothetical protein